MATDLERLVVSLEANIKKYERELSRSRGVADRALRDVESSISSSAGRIESQMARVGASIRLGIAGALAGITLGGLNGLVDSYTKVQNSLKVTGLQGDKLTATFDQLFDIAQKQGAPIETLVSLYSRAAQTQKELNASSRDLVTFTNSVATALRAGGVGAVQADQALTQLGQALGSGKVQWEDLESVVDSAPTILQAAAAGIKEANGSVGTLIQLVKDGKVSSEALFRAIIAGLPAVQQLSDRTSETSSQGITRLKNALTELFGKMSESTGASSTAIAALDNVRKSIENLTDQIPGAVKALSDYFEKLSKAPYFQSLVKSIAASEGGDTPAEAAVPGFKSAPKTGASAGAPNAVEGLDKLREALKTRADAIAGSTKEAAKNTSDATKSIFDQVEELDRQARAVKPISVTDYKVPGEKDKKAGGGGKGGGKERENELQRETAEIVKRTGALQSELTTVGQSAGAAAEAEAKFKLLEAAKKANITVGPALMADIERTAAAFGTATEELEKAEAAQRKLEATSRQAGAMLSDAFSDAIVNGEKLTTVIDRLIKSLATRGIDSIFDSFFGKGGAGTNFLSSILGGLDGGVGSSPTGGVRLFKGGGYTGPGGRNKPAGVVHAGEVVWSQDDVRRAGGPVVVDAMRRGGRGYAGGGIVGAPLVPTSPGRVIPARARPSAPSSMSLAIDVSGARGNQEIMSMVQAGVAAGMSQVQSNIGRNINGIVANGRRRYVRA